MKNKIKKGWNILRNDGIREFIRRSFVFVIFSFRAVSHIILLRNRGDVAQSLKSFLSSDPKEVFAFARRTFVGAFGPMQVEEEFLKLLEIFKKAEPKAVMEIGTANGGTLFCFSKLAPGDATIVSVDLPEGKFGGGYPEWKMPLYRAFAKEGQDLRLLREDSHAPGTLEKVKKILAGRQVDFLFIDGDHSYEGVKRDFEMYSPLVRKGGVIALHDVAVHPKESECFVSDFWEELCRGRGDACQAIIKDTSQGWAGIGVLFI